MIRAGQDLACPQPFNQGVFWCIELEKLGSFQKFLHQSSKQDCSQGLLNTVSLFLRIPILGGLQKEWHHTALPTLQEHYEGPIHCQPVQLILLSKAKASKHEREFSVVRRRGRGIVRSVGSIWSKSPVELSRLLRSRSFPKVFPTKFHEIVKILIVLLHALWHTCQAYVCQIGCFWPV